MNTFFANDFDTHTCIFKSATPPPPPQKKKHFKTKLRPLFRILVSCFRKCTYIFLSWATSLSVEKNNNSFKSPHDGIIANGHPTSS